MRDLLFLLLRVLVHAKQQLVHLHLRTEGTQWTHTKSTHTVEHIPCPARAGMAGQLAWQGCDRTSRAAQRHEPGASGAPAERWVPCRTGSAAPAAAAHSFRHCTHQNRRRTLKPVTPLPSGATAATATHKACHRAHAKDRANTLSTRQLVSQGGKVHPHTHVGVSSRPALAWSARSFTNRKSPGNLNGGPRRLQHSRMVDASSPYMRDTNADSA
jgi:hypothetical protein